MTSAGSGLAGSLGGLRVLDLTRNLAGPFCTMLLGDLGADVVKVERIGYGDDTRSWMPPGWGGQSVAFLSANRNKRSLAVDLDAPDGQEIVANLARRADILVETFRPGSLEKRGLGYRDLQVANPAIVYCSISAYGQSGPLRDTAGYDPVLQARSGIMSLTGHPDGPPARLGVSAVDLGTALWATIGVLAAINTRHETGRGSRVDASLYATAAWWLSHQVAGFLATGTVQARSGTASPFIAPYEAFGTADEDLLIAAANDRLFTALVETIGLPELAVDPRFLTNPDRVTNRVELHGTLEARLRERPATEWEQLLGAQLIPCSRIRTVADLVADEQFQALGLLADVPHPLIPNLRLVDLPINRDGAATPHRRPPPMLGEHTNEVLRELGYGVERIRALETGGVISQSGGAGGQS